MWLILALAAWMVVVYVWLRWRLNGRERFSHTSSPSPDPGSYGGSFGGGDGGFDAGGGGCGDGGGGGGCD
jgi:hypothetical protein